MNENSVRRDVRIVRASQKDDVPKAPMRDERQRDTRPGQFTIQGAFLDLTDAGAGAFDADNAPA